MNSDYKAYDVCLIDFGKAEFAGEQGGIRPAVIIQNVLGNQYSGTTIVIPFTSVLKNTKQPTHSLFYPEEGNGLCCVSMLLGECVRQISKERIIKLCGKIVDPRDRHKIKKVYTANFAW